MAATVDIKTLTKEEKLKLYRDLKRRKRQATAEERIKKIVGMVPPTPSHPDQLQEKTTRDKTNALKASGEGQSTSPVLTDTPAEDAPPPIFQHEPEQPFPEATRASPLVPPHGGTKKEVVPVQRTFFTLLMVRRIQLVGCLGLSFILGWWSIFWKASVVDVPNFLAIFVAFEVGLAFCCKHVGVTHGGQAVEYQEFPPQKDDPLDKYIKYFNMLLIGGEWFILVGRVATDFCLFVFCTVVVISLFA